MHNVLRVDVVIEDGVHTYIYATHPLSMYILMYLHHVVSILSITTETMSANDEDYLDLLYFEQKEIVNGIA